MCELGLVHSEGVQLGYDSRHELHVPCIHLVDSVSLMPIGQADSTAFLSTAL